MCCLFCMRSNFELVVKFLQLNPNFLYARKWSKRSKYGKFWSKWQIWWINQDTTLKYTKCKPSKMLFFTINWHFGWNMSSMKLWQSTINTDIPREFTEIVQVIHFARLKVSPCFLSRRHTDVRIYQFNACSPAKYYGRRKNKFTLYFMTTALISCTLSRAL